ncbi:putative malate dehydrogenase, mitochondrial [Smittium culicis]|uniref:malate dehydrogenase n=1 Tax=Smittium culicis TaxID=133412 RepID=A0A1R1YRS8_9FUNG|nr:putative malate dehydrogenase, mitochondrial [Smittium culicis]
MVRVAVLGAAGGIGQPLSLLIKLNKDVTALHMYDIVRCPGVAADISHINTNSTVTAFQGNDSLKDCLTGMDIVVIPAGVPRKPGMTRDDLFGVNAGIVRDLIQAVSENCPNALVCIISNPVNSTVPIAAEILKKNGVYDPKRLFGVSSLDIVRASRFVRDIRPDFDASTPIPVIGGHSGNTIVPILSHIQNLVNLSQDEIKTLTHRIQFGGDEVVQAKNGEGSATLSMAYAGYRFVSSLISAINGQSTTECCYIDLSVDPAGADYYRQLGASDLAFFSVNASIGPNGVSSILPLSSISSFEKDLVKAAVSPILSNIAAGVSFVNK